MQRRLAAMGAPGKKYTTDVPAHTPGRVPGGSKRKRAPPADKKKPFNKGPLLQELAAAMELWEADQTRSVGVWTDARLDLKAAQQRASLAGAVHTYNGVGITAALFLPSSFVIHVLIAAPFDARCCCVWCLVL